MSVYSFENKAFGSLLVYGSLAVTKTLLMVPITVFFRRKYKSVASLEDARFYAPGREKTQKFLLQPKDEVERVRRAHLNDLENVIPFVLTSILYVGTKPDPVTALWHFRIFLLSRALHTVVYVLGIRQPFRFLTYTVGMASLASITLQTIAATWKYL